MKKKNKNNEKTNINTKSITKPPKKSTVKSSQKSPRHLPFPPCESLYINNLNDKIKAEELKTNLFLLFSEFGDILNINVNKRKLRGQAFILYKDGACAENARKFLDKTNFLGKKMNVNFAKKASKLRERLMEREESLGGEDGKRRVKEGGDGKRRKLEDGDDGDNMSLLSRKRKRDEKCEKEEMKKGK